jgi:hypothetical protein
VGRVIIDSFAEADYRALRNEKRIQAVLLGMKDPGLCGGVGEAAQPPLGLPGLLGLKRRNDYRLTGAAGTTGYGNTSRV